MGEFDFIEFKSNPKIRAILAVLCLKTWIMDFCVLHVNQGGLLDV